MTRDGNIAVASPSITRGPSHLIHFVDSFALDHKEQHNSGTTKYGFYLGTNLQPRGTYMYLFFICLMLTACTSAMISSPI